MKLNKSLITALGISLFSTITFSDLTIQSVKADSISQTENATDNTATTDSQADTLQDNSDQNFTQSNAVSSPVTLSSSSTPSTQQSQTEDLSSGISGDNTPTTNTDEEQTVNISFKNFTADQTTPPLVKDKDGNTLTYTTTAKTGNTISITDIPKDITDKLHPFYSLTTSSNTPNSPIQILKDQNDYSFAVQSSFYRPTITLPDENKTSVSSEQWFSPGVDGMSYYKINGTNLTDYTINGYGYSYLTFDANHTKMVPNSDKKQLILTYDTSADYIASGQKLYAVYDTPLPQDITLTYHDTLGNEIHPSDTVSSLTGKSITDPSTLIPQTTQISNYTYLKTDKTLPYSVGTSNQLNLIFKQNDLNTLTVNYIDKDSKKTIYTDYIQGASGDSVALKDIKDLNNQYKLVDANDLNQINQLPDKDLTINIDVALNTVNFTLNQTLAGRNYLQNMKLIPDSTAEMVNLDPNVLSDDLSKISSFSFSNSDDPSQAGTFDETVLEQYAGSGYTTTDLINAVAATFNNTASLGSNININITYKDITPKVSISYMDSNTVVNSLDLPDEDTDLNSFINDNLPENYALENKDDPYVITKDSDGNITLNVAIKKTTDSDNNGNGNSGNGGNSTGSSNDYIGDKEGIEETLGTHPNLSSITIYDDGGNDTGMTVGPNTNWFTDELLRLNGKIYYRIATNQWVSASDIYIYYANPDYIQTYSDSDKQILTSQNKTIQNRILSAGSDWYSDRYAYFNDQKYYRVATNEWISADDAFEYQKIDQVINTQNNIQLFDDCGNAVRTISSLSLKTDKVATINGSKMYRVATNEWVKASNLK